MANIRKNSMKDQVYEIIKDKILTGKYDLGQPVNISTLCTELGVSNTPVREALSRLEVEGLVVSDMNKKVKVVTINEELQKEIDHFFFTIYAGSYQTCLFQNRIELLISLMEKAIIRQEKVLDAKNYMAFAKEAINFDRCFVAATENQRLLEHHDQLSPILFLLTRYIHNNGNENREGTLEEHRQILAAVKEGDAAKVHERLFAHYSKSLNK